MTRLRHAFNTASFTEISAEFNLHHGDRREEQYAVSDRRDPILRVVETAGTPGDHTALKPPATTSPSKESRSPDDVISRPRLLIVDDDRDAADALVEVLTRRGYAAKTAYDGDAAHDAIDAFEPEIAMVDVRLGRENGIDLIGQFKQKRPQLPCIVMTAYADVDVAVEAVRNGAYDFLRKPLDISLLEAALGRCQELVQVWQEKARAEGNLSTQRKWLRAALDNMHGGIFMFDKDLKIQVASPNFSEMYSFPAELANIGASALDIMSYRANRGDYGPGDPAELVNMRSKRYQINKATTVEDEVVGGRLMELVLSPLPEGGIVGVFNDITERKKQEQHLRQVMDEANVATRTKSEFLASMSHELRTPLNSILGFAEMIGDQHIGPIGNLRYADYAKTIMVSGKLLLGMVNDILDIERIESGQFKLEIEHLDLGDVINECQKILQSRADLKGVSLRVDDGQINTIVPLDADRRVLSQILINLITNAIKFTPKGGAVVLSARATNNHHEIEVRDTGIGIPKEKIPTLTDPFTRHEPDPFLAQDGVGLGLAICSSLIAQHKGDLKIESEIGKGTVVTVTLPSRA